MKRDLLFGVRKAEASEWKKWGTLFLSAEWTYDAVDFLTQAGDKDALKQLRAKTCESGDVFIFLKIQKSLTGHTDLEATEKDLLLQCSEKAESLGKYRYAMKGFEKLGLTERVAKIRELIANDGDIIAEAETQVFIPAITEESDGEEEK